MGIPEREATYKVITGAYQSGDTVDESIYEFEKLVNKKIKDGWLPVGGMSTSAIVTGGNLVTIFYYQAMILPAGTMSEEQIQQFLNIGRR